METEGAGAPTGAEPLLHIVDTPVMGRVDWSPLPYGTGWTGLQELPTEAP